MDFNDIKCTVRSILTSSRDAVSVEKFRRLFRKFEGMNVPYTSLGFKSDIELLQSMPDVLTLPENPNSSSIMCLILNKKTYHMRMLVNKQKQRKKRKSKSNGNGDIQNKYQNIFNRIKVTAHFFDDNNQNNQLSTSNSRIDINKITLNQNGTHCFGNVMNKLQANLDLITSQDQMQTNKIKLEEPINQGENLAIIVEVKKNVQNQLDLIINNKEVLENIDQKKTED